VAAQVTHLSSGKTTVKNKLVKLNIPKADLRYLFAGKESIEGVEGGESKLIAIEDVFQEMNERYPDYVRAMYPNTRSAKRR
jgi:broad-specificity NMP kinase